MAYRMYPHAEVSDSARVHPRPCLTKRTDMGNGSCEYITPAVRIDPAPVALGLLIVKLGCFPTRGSGCLAIMKAPGTWEMNLLISSTSALDAVAYRIGMSCTVVPSSKLL